MRGCITVGFLFSGPGGTFNYGHLMVFFYVRGGYTGGAKGAMAPQSVWPPGPNFLDPPLVNVLAMLRW